MKPEPKTPYKYQEIENKRNDFIFMLKWSIISTLVIASGLIAMIILLT